MNPPFYRVNDLSVLSALSGGVLRRLSGAGIGRVSVACVLSGVLLAVVPASAQPAGAQEPATGKGVGRAEALFAKGNEHYQADRFAEAAAAYRQAWELQKTYDIAANLGQAELRLGKEPEAAGYLAFALRSWPVVSKETPRSLAATRLGELRKKLGLLRVRVNVTEAEVWVDGAPLRDSPVAPEMFVRPGEHRIRASREGYEPLEVELSIGKGESREVPLSLSPIERRPASAVVAKQEGAGPWPLLVGAGVTVVSVGVGVGFTVAARAKYADAERIGATFNDETKAHCAKSENSSSEACGSIKGLNLAGDDLQYAGTAGFFVGGAALAGTVLYYVLLPSKQERREGARVRPVIAASLGGVQVSGDF